jgi:electron transfer flavoprotein beta subunit
MRIGVCVKQVDLRPEVDPLSGAVAETDARFAGVSPADQAALEIALRLAEAWEGDVVAVTAGPPRADAALRDCLAAGASSAVRADVGADASSRAVAAALAAQLTDADLVCCGDWSLDRGSGSVPAFVAEELDAAQALGLVAVEPGPAAGVLDVERRLDQGRRERLRVATPAVLSVEAGCARLRRAGLAAVLAARAAAIEVASPPAVPPDPVRVVSTGPYRPRTRVLSPPSPELDARGRILALTGALSDREPPRTLVLGPDEAADALLDQLRAWGYLDGRSR